jgi:hypothetical protein
MTLKSLANHFNLDRVKKYGTQRMPTKYKPLTTVDKPVKKKDSTSSTSTTTSSCASGLRCRSAKIRPQLNSNLKKIGGGGGKKRPCKASALLEQIPICKLQKTLQKYGCCHNLLQNVISLDYYECHDDGDND